MSSYKPIKKKQNIGAADRIISIEKKPFESAPALSFLNSYEETITAIPAYYDPFKPEVSNAAAVTYNVNRVINTLSDRTVALRHNGSTVDMEISVDSYTYIPKEPIVAPYSNNPTLPKIREGDFYNRSTTTYIYSSIEVPKASNKIWDGRYSRCVDLQGYDVPNTDRLPEVIAEVKSKLDNPTNLYTVLPIAGMATTVAPPKKDPYAATYKVKIEQFISTHYNSTALPRHPKGEAPTDLYQELPQDGGDRKFELQEAFVAAVLDGPYFVKWANVYRYADTAPGVDDDCGHKIVDYDQDGDAVIVLGHLCGLEPPEPITLCQSYSKVFGYVETGDYDYLIEPPDTVRDQCKPYGGKVSALVTHLEYSVPNVLANGISLADVSLPARFRVPVTFRLQQSANNTEAAYFKTRICWTAECNTILDDDWYLDNIDYVDYEYTDNN